MSWNVLVEIERRKYLRWRIKDTASRWFGLMAVILCLYLGFAESVGASPFWNQVDKCMHFILFGIFSVTFLQYSRAKIFKQLNPWPRILVLFTILFACGILSEVSHIYLPKRQFELKDMLANTLGILAFGIPFAWLRPFKTNIDHGYSNLNTNIQDHSNQPLKIRLLQKLPHGKQTRRDQIRSRRSKRFGKQ